MVETGEPVKLFGAMIGVATAGGVEKELLIEKPTVKIKAGEEEQADAEESSELPASSVDTEHNEAAHVDEEIAAGDSSGSEEKHLKKPTKILPCPRCHSLDTKFCYFNNYNVNQPRHFCKACQRYWTDGGAMRNMAIGAGRRKSKSSSSSCQYKEITLLEAAHNNPEQPPDRTILAFRKGLLSHEYPSEKNQKGSTNSISAIHETADSVMTQTASSSGACQPSMIAIPSPWDAGHTLCTPCLPVSFYLVNTYQTPRRPGGVSVPTPIRPPVPMFGKHSRNGDMILGKNSLEEGVCSTRDPPSADPSNTSNAREGFRPRGFLGVFHHPKADADALPKANVYAALQANPSAMMRSLEFHENIMWRNDIYG